jgi:hypothetical protein
MGFTPPELCDEAKNTAFIPGSPLATRHRQGLEFNVSLIGQHGAVEAAQSFF